MTVACPNCATQIEISRRITGDQMLCSHCSAWLRVEHLDRGRTVLHLVNSPTQIESRSDIIERMKRSFKR